MKVILTDKSNVHSPEAIITLLQKRMMLIWNYRISNSVRKVIFKSIPTPYEIVLDGSKYTINFSNSVLFELVHSGNGLSDFDKYLMEIENLLIWQL